MPPRMLPPPPGPQSIPPIPPPPAATGASQVSTSASASESAAHRTTSMAVHSACENAAGFAPKGTEVHAARQTCAQEQQASASSAASSVAASPESSDDAGKADDGDETGGLGLGLVSWLCGEACARRLSSLLYGPVARKPLLPTSARSSSSPAAGGDESWSLSGSSAALGRRGLLHRQGSARTSSTHGAVELMEGAAGALPDESYV
jgi:hypothetical protein